MITVELGVTPDQISSSPRIEDIKFPRVWEELGLEYEEIVAANKVVKLFRRRKQVANILSHAKTFIKQEDERLTSSTYLTREKMEEVSQNPIIIHKLITSRILSLHPEWHDFLAIEETDDNGVIHASKPEVKHRYHPKAPYCLNLTVLDSLQSPPGFPSGL